MKSYICTLIALVIIGCGKKVEPISSVVGTPTDAVKNEIHAIQSGDSAELVNNIIVREKDEIVKSYGSIRNYLDSMKLYKLDLHSIGEYHDSSLSSIVKVYISGTVHYKTDSTKFDSSYYNVVQEDNKWRLTTYYAMRQKK